MGFLVNTVQGYKPKKQKHEFYLYCMFLTQSDCKQDLK